MSKNPTSSGFWYALIAFPALGASLVGPDIIHMEILGKKIFFLFCIVLAVLSIWVGKVKERREGKSADQNEGNSRMIPFYGMIAGGLIFVVCAAWYFWPTEDGKGPVPSTMVAAPQTMPLPPQERKGLPQDDSSGVEVCSHPDFEINFSDPFTVEHDDDGKTVLLWFVVNGRNKSDRYIRDISGYVEGDVDGVHYPIYFRTMVDGLYKTFLPEKTGGIPPDSNFEVSVDFGWVYSPGKYMPLDDILKRLGSFVLVINRGEEVCARRYSAEYVMGVTEAYERKRREDALKQRRVEPLK